MALKSAFKERFEDMETARNQRLLLLQAEKELQKTKSLILSAKHSNISLLEQRCLILDQNFASANFRISQHNSQLEFLHRIFQSSSQQFRDLNDQLEQLEQLDKEREKCYAMNYAEMTEFMDKTWLFAGDLRIKVEELRRHRNELKLLCSGLQKDGGDAQSLDIQAAEIRNSELWALKKKVASGLESNKQEISELQKQLQSLR